jgi:hypothetical protein
MKTNNYISRNALTLITTCLLLFSIYGTSQARSSDAETQQPSRDDARLIVQRVPDLGNAVAVDLYIDGVAVQPITYGRTYEGSLPAGRHVLSVVATPHAKWPTPSQIVLHVRKGRTYSFTAMGDGSGHLILKRA